MAEGPWRLGIAGVPAGVDAVACRRHTDEQSIPRGAWSRTSAQLGGQSACVAPASLINESAKLLPATVARVNWRIPFDGARDGWALAT